MPKEFIKLFGYAIGGYAVGLASGIIIIILVIINVFVAFTSPLAGGVMFVLLIITGIIGIVLLWNWIFNDEESTN